MGIDYLPSLRENYLKGGLLEKDILPNPFQQFHLWLEEAINAQQKEPNAMTIATINKDGKPSARIVLLKNLDERGFVFFTNYDSQKGQDLTANPYASLVFWWGELERQVRVEGEVEKITPAESDEYFNVRPQGSKLGAWASPQSQVIPNREVLDNNLKNLEEEYQGKTVPRPNHWGGFRVIPQKIEFWQGRANRLHDRLCYTLKDNQWIIERLAP
ncbi:pyridoxamine 5'-phosphate oxidase [Cyanobacterium stanieri LEGE 03274]|uniref:Pyridoxine/pyridoxamine 5'-phosphate oxidase n=1 Tax=Cyanobacterium stanieri LEGE 03274 TaxID=1828756 RepID=A0ABR9V0E8_9CHRO|nr:pyridoxamine 5'-phosphate oxidase [Cyanobacterium stanieri]MBE9221342.1 pyridoxamine 5'-phosphate oxidase [Cyanobacterium stanieri LEGE 03274]